MIQGEKFSFSFVCQINAKECSCENKWEVILTGEHDVIPWEPKKYSRPKTTTAVCQTPSIRRPVTQMIRVVRNSSKVNKTWSLIKNIYLIESVTSQLPFPESYRRCATQPLGFHNRPSLRSSTLHKSSIIFWNLPRKYFFVYKKGTIKQF